MSRHSCPAVKSAFGKKRVDGGEGKKGTWYLAGDGWLVTEKASTEWFLATFTSRALPNWREGYDLEKRGLKKEN